MCTINCVSSINPFIPTAPKVKRESVENIQGRLKSRWQRLPFIENDDKRVAEKVKRVWVVAWNRGIPAPFGITKSSPHLSDSATLPESTSPSFPTSRAPRLPSRIISLSYPSTWNRDEKSLSLSLFFLILPFTFIC